MKFQYTTTHSFDGENDVELRILYVYTPPSPERGPTYDCGGGPPEYAEVDVLGVMVDGRASTPTQWDMVIENERLFNEMELHGADCVADERAAAAEYRAEMRGEDL
tara:strand:- start:13 stop:330 length:318 start_codon:yes stop_codon:yes gene_type:complete